MKHTGPPRLSSSSSDAPRLLRVALEEKIRADEPAEAQLSAVAALLGIGPALGGAPPEPPPIPPAPPAALTKAATLKLLPYAIKSVVIGSLAGTMAWKASTLIAPAPTPTQRSEATQQNPSPQAAISPPAVANTDSPNAQEPEPPPEANIASPRPTPGITRGPAPTPAVPLPLLSPLENTDIPAPNVASEHLETEATLLARAKHYVSLEPERAILLVNEHALRFPRGILQQEAEVIAIEALAQGAKKQFAIERLNQFRNRYPHSVHLPRLNALILGQNRE